MRFELAAMPLENRNPPGDWCSCSLIPALNMNIVPSTYICIFIVVLAVNILVLVLVSSTIHFNDFNTSVAATTNLLVAVVCRNEHFVNFLFTVFVNKSTTLPLPIRRRFAKIYSCYGALHSGCATAALMWYAAFTFKAVAPVINRGIASNPLALISCTSMSLLLVIILFALPCVRALHHNFFECVHRYCGWTVMALLVVELILDAYDEDSSSPGAFWEKFVTDARVWQAALLVMLIIYPWLYLRRRRVKAYRVSPHALVLNFNYMDVQFGQAIRLSDSPFRETHPFAVIPNARSSVKKLTDDEAELWHIDQKGFSVIISRAGDWTSRIIDNPPKEIWTRGVPQYGALRVATLFKPCIVMATGSGIGPCLGIFVQKPDHPVRIIWSCRSPCETYSPTLVSTVLRVDPSAVIHDTDVSGRPDLVQLATTLWETGDFEAVVFISSKPTTRTVISGLEANGITAFGVIFDS